MFILKTKDVGTSMFAKGQKVESDIDLWYKRVGQINFQSFKNCSQNRWYLDCKTSVVGKVKYLKLGRSGSNIGFHSPMRRIGVRIISI